MQEDRMPSILGQRIEKTKENKYGYIDIDLNNLKIDSPTVLCFGGNYVVGRRLANGLAKFVFNLIHAQPSDKNLKVYSLMYGSLDNNPTAADVSAKEIIDLTNSIFLPLVCKDGKRIDTQTAQKNMRNLTIVSHCFGMDLANLLACTIADKMLELKYSNPEIISILKQVTNISYAPHKAAVFPLFCNIDFYSMKDRYNKYYSHIEKTNNALFAATTLNKKENHLTIIADSFLGDYDDADTFFDEHMLDLLKKDKNWQLTAITEQPKFIKNHSNKTKEELFSRAETMSVCFGLCVAESVSNSIDNKQSKNLIEIDLEKIKDNIDYLINEQSKKEKTEKIVEIVHSKKEEHSLKV